MKRPSILVAGRASAIITLAGLCSAPACADVLEIGNDGASYWVAGGAPAAVEMSAPYAAPAALEEVPADIAVPEYALADTEQHASVVPDMYNAKVRELAARFDLSPALIEALVWQESRWRHKSTSPKGAQGLAQLMPGTAREMGVDPRDPFANLEGGARYLREQLDRFEGDLEKALAAYNAGPGRVEAADGIPNIRETKNYVAAIMGRLSNHSRSTE